MYGITDSHHTWTFDKLKDHHSGSSFCSRAAHVWQNRCHCIHKQHTWVLSILPLWLMYGYVWLNETVIIVKGNHVWLRSVSKVKFFENITRAPGLALSVNTGWTANKDPRNNVVFLQRCSCCPPVAGSDFEDRTSSRDTILSICSSLCLSMSTGCEEAAAAVCGWALDNWV